MMSAGGAAILEKVGGGVKIYSIACLVFSLERCKLLRPWRIVSVGSLPPLFWVVV